MGFRKEYLAKRLSAGKAISTIQSGNWVDYAAFCGAPEYLDAELAKRVNILFDVKIRAEGFPGEAAVAKADPSGKRFIYNSWHFSGPERRLHDHGMCHYIPFVYHEGPSHYRQNIGTDVFMVRVAPMDKNGFFNLGISNSLSRAIADRAKTIIVEVNTNMPVCYGGNSEALHISEVDWIVESDNRPLLVLPEPVLTETDQTIAKMIVNEIEDGACIQLGIGGMPNAVGKIIAQSDLKDLGVHSEMLADAYLDMYEAGRITSRRKSLDPGKMVYTFALGSRRLYDFLDHNAACASYPVDYVNKLENISQNDRMISINNAMEIDLYGQVSSESTGYRHISGTGGQFDFAYGAYHARGGKSFICLTSTVTDKKGNTHSRIRPVFEQGTVVTLPRTITHYVVTEYGIVNLKGKSTWERAEALINIAHPDFRDELIREAEIMGIWTAANRKDEIWAKRDEKRRAA